jgi:ribosomal protein L40E
MSPEEGGKRMLCSNCGFTNTDDARFCEMCGTPLVPPAPVPTETDSSRICPNCGTVNGGVGKFCRNCGSTLDPAGERSVALPETPSPAKPRRPRKKKLPVETAPPEDTSESEILSRPPSPETEEFPPEKPRRAPRKRRAPGEEATSAATLREEPAPGDLPVTPEEAPSSAGEDPARDTTGEETFPPSLPSPTEAAEIDEARAIEEKLASPESPMPPSETEVDMADLDTLLFGEAPDRGEGQGLLVPDEASREGAEEETRETLPPAEDLLPSALGEIPPEDAVSPPPEGAASPEDKIPGEMITGSGPGTSEPAPEPAAPSPDSSGGEYLSMEELQDLVNRAAGLEPKSFDSPSPGEPERVSAPSAPPPAPPETLSPGGKTEAEEGSDPKPPERAGTTLPMDPVPEGPPDRTGPVASSPTEPAPTTVAPAETAQPVAPRFQMPRLSMPRLSMPRFRIPGIPFRRIGRFVGRALLGTLKGLGLALLYLLLLTLGGGIGILLAKLF